MLDKDYFKGKKITVVGLGRSGKAASEVLLKLGAKVFITEKENSDELRSAAAKLPKDISFELGNHTESAIAASCLVVLSPGVPNDSKAIQISRTHKIPIISEIELAFQLCPCPIVAVTGTNGKTTVTTLIGEILKNKFKRAFILGNIGTPFCSKVLEMDKNDIVSLEVSSFQLEYIDKFKPKVAVVLNFTPDHLDRHKDLDDYLSAKKRIFKNQDRDDYAVLNSDDNIVKSMADAVKANVLYFGKEMKKQSDLGSLNPNFLAAFVVGGIFGIDKQAMLKIFHEFKGVEHRVEFVRTINGVDFLNDSKATNIDSTLWAFDIISKPIILIAGGREKGNDFRTIRDIAKKKVRLLITLGEAKEKIQKALSDILPTKEAKDLKEAVSLAKENAKSGDCVLFSPMCKSFDMFKNYEERGKIFKDLVNKL